MTELRTQHRGKSHPNGREALIAHPCVAVLIASDAMLKARANARLCAHSERASDRSCYRATSFAATQNRTQWEKF